MDEMDESLEDLKVDRMKHKMMRLKTNLVRSPSLGSTIQVYKSRLYELSKWTSQRSTHMSTTNLFDENKQKLRNLRAMQNGYHVASLYHRFEFIDRALFLLVLVSMVIIASYVRVCIIKTELELKTIRPIIFTKYFPTLTNPQQILETSNRAYFLLYINEIVTVMTVIMSFFRYSLQKDYETTQKNQVSIINQVYQILLLVVQPYSFLKTIFVKMELQSPNKSENINPIFVELNIILVISSIILKFILILRFVLWHNLCYIFNIKSQKFFRPSFNRICKMYSCDKNYLIIIKCLFKQNFLTFIGGFFIISVIPSAYCLRIVESHYDGRFISILDCIWFTLISMSTVGYGDLYATTPLGIIIDSFLMYSGVVLASLLVSALKDIFTLTYRQKRALNLHKRLMTKGQLREIAATFIAKSMSRRWRQRKLNISLPVSQEQRISRRRFNQIHIILKCRQQKHLNLYSDMGNQFEAAKLQLRQLLQISQNNINLLSQVKKLRLKRRSSKFERLLIPKSKFQELLRARLNSEGSLKEILDQFDEQIPRSIFQPIPSRPKKASTKIYKPQN